MKLTVTIKNSVTGASYDVQFDNRQRVRTTLRVLEESLPELFEQLQKPILIQSLRSRRRLEASRTYEESHIYSGDELILKDQKRMLEIE